MKILWKLDQHRMLKKAGISHSLFLDAISYTYRKNKYREWNDLGVKEAEKLGIMFSRETPPQSLFEIFFDGIYDFADFRPHEGDVIIDVGAGYGDSALWWWKKFGAVVYAYEVLPHVYKVLAENIRLNNASVNAFNIAIGDGSLTEGYLHSSGNMLQIANHPKEGKNFLTTKIDSLNLPEPVLIKVDVEGFELKVLRGAEKTIEAHKPRIIIETHSTALRKECHTFFEKHGYSLEHVGRTVKPKNSWMNEVTNLFYSSD